MFEGMLKHTGQLVNTGKNVVVVFMTLPEDPHNALVIDTDALPDLYNEALRKIVESTEAQQSKNLADVLARRMTPDGSNMTMLAKFHAANRLMKTPVQNVVMTPKKGVRWPLSDVVKAMQEQTTPQNFDELDPETKAAISAEVKKFNMHAHNQDGSTQAGIQADARALLDMAQLLEADAQSKREQAYRMDPSLRPQHARAMAVALDTSAASTIQSQDMSTKVDGKKKMTSRNKTKVATPAN